MTVKGRVVNPITGEGFASAKLVLYRSTLDFPSGQKSVKETTTDEEGYFEISKASLYKCYLVCNDVGISDYYPIGWEQKDDVPLFDAFTISVKKGKVMHADYYAVPYGNYKYTIKNTSCFDQTDTLVLNIKYQIPNVSDNSTTYTGCYEYIGSVYTKRPMGWYFFTGYYKKNNVVTIFSDSIYIDNGGFHEWIFEY